MNDHYMKRLNLILWSLLVATNMFAVVTWDGTTSTAWTQGAGTESSPYIISTPAHLVYLAAQVNTGTTYSGVYFKQTQDFNLNSKTWTSIGTTTNQFSGVYDGGSKYISNLKNPIFGYINNAEIKNLTLQGANMSSGSSGTASLVYQTLGSCKITRCHNKINLTATGKRNCGGLVELATGTKLELAVCTNSGTCCVSANVATSSTDTICCGGLVALSRVQTLKLTSCSSTGACTTGSVSSSFYGGLFGGGLVGKAFGTVYISKCFSTGDIFDGKYSGGHLIGDLRKATKCTIQLSYAKGKARCLLVSYCATNCEIKGCYVIGSCNADNLTYPIGDLGTAKVTSCYFTAGYGGRLSRTPEYCFVYSSLVDGTTYVSEESIKHPLFLPRINVLDEYFTMDYEGVNDGFPILKWQAGTRYKVAVTCDANRGTVTGGGDYPNGYSATLTATPKDGCTFVGWSDGNTDNPRSVTVSGNATYAAQFTKSSYTIYVNQDCTSYIE